MWFIILIILILLFSVVWVITVYLGGANQQGAYDQGYLQPEPTDTGVQLQATDDQGNPVTISWAIIQAPGVATE